MVNINVSKLLSSSGSNSKNSITFNHSKEAGSLSKHSNSNNKTFNTNYNKPSPQNKFNTSSSINSKYSKKAATSVNNSIKSASNQFNRNTKKSITAKRKNIYDKLMKNNKNTKKIQQNKKDDSQIIDENELRDIVNDVNINYQGDSNSTTNGNVKITNITNIILNVKNIGPKSFDMKNLTSQKGKDIMMRDMKSLHLITQRALTTNNAKMNSVDSFDDERRSFLNFRNINMKKELYIDDNSDLDQLMCNIFTK